MTYLLTREAVASRFLIIGHGREQQGDATVGAKVAEVIANWHLPSVKSMSVLHLTPELINDIVAQCRNHILYKAFR